MKKFEIQVVRTVKSVHTFEVEDESEYKAQMQALEDASNYEFEDMESSVIYEIERCEEL